MNTESSEIESEIDDVPAPAKKPPRAGAAMAFLAFIFALTALAGTAWMWWQDELAREQGDDRVITEIARLERAHSEFSLKLKQAGEEMESLVDDDSSAKFDALDKRLDAGDVQLDSLDQSVRDQIALSRSLQAAAEFMQGRLLAVEAAVAGLSSNELDAGGELDLAEIDYLLRLASERLKLFSDPLAADTALEIADLHLAAMDNPMYLGVRQDIAVARRELAAVDLPDHVEITGRLDTIQEAIALLPFRGEVAVNQDSSPAMETGWWAKVKGAFSNLVTVRRSTAEENERISLEDKDLIRQRLWLQLELAHLALMRREQGTFRNSLEGARHMLSTWFETPDGGYQAALRGIDELLALKIEADVPDISAPWTSLRLVREGRPRPVSAPSAAVQAEPAVDLPTEQQEPGEDPE